MRRFFYRINFSTVGAFFFATAFLPGCIQSTKETPEYINAPENLAISLIVAPTYNLSFFVENREGAFSGYGIFTAATAADADIYAGSDISAASAFCLAPSDYALRFDYKTLIAIEVGPGALFSTANTLCAITSLTLTSGNYVAVRARVERTTNPWSAAAIVRVP